MHTKIRFFTGALAAMMMAGVLLVPLQQAQAQSEDGRRNTTLGLGALTGYLFTRRGSKVPAFISAGATAYAYKRYDDAVKARRKRDDAARRRRAYRAGYQARRHAYR